MRHALLLLPLFFIPLVAIAASDDITRVEVKGGNAQQQRRQDSAGRIIVARDDLMRFGDSSVADALRRQPGISVVNGAIQLRGLGGGRTQILLNGEPVPPGFSPDSLAPAMIERIEILRSASADSSSQGIAGSINIVLRKPTSPVQALATLAAAHAGIAWSPDGALDWSRSSETASGTFSSSVAAHAVRNRYGFDSTIAGHSAGNGRSTHETGHGLTERISLTPRLHWKFEDGATLAWQSLLDLTRNDNHGQARETVLRGASSAYPHNGFDTAARTITARSDASWNQRLGETGRFEWKVGLAHNRRDSDYLFVGSDAGAVRLWQREVLSNAVDNSASTSGKWRHGTDSGHALAIGWDSLLASRSEWRRQTDANADGSPGGLLDQRYTARVRRLALFAQSEWTPAPGLDLYAGLRWELLHTRTNGRDLANIANQSKVLSPVAHLRWQLPGSRDQLRLALARTYKAPATRDLVPRRFTVNNDNDPNNSHAQGNPRLQPELAWGVDLAFESYFGRASMFGASAYHRRIADVILPFLFLDNGEWVTTPRNAGLAVTRGVEVDMKTVLGSSGVTARATLSRNWSRVASVPGPDNRLGEQIPLVLNAGLDYRLQGGATIGFNWNLQAGGSTRTSARQWRGRGSVRRLDLHSRWHIGKKLALRLTAANLLAPDTRNTLRYEATSGSTDWRSSAIASDRTIKLAAEISL